MATPLGITLPIRVGANGYFETTTDVMTQVRSNLKNLLMTQKGERPMQPSFGSDLHKYVFEPMTDNAMANVQAVIEAAVNQWMPFVQIIAVDKKFNYDSDTMEITVGFTTVIDPTNVASLTLNF